MRPLLLALLTAASAAGGPLAKRFAVPLSEIERDQPKTEVPVQLGARALALQMTFDGQGEPWLKVREGAATKAAALAKLGEPVALNLPGGPVTVQSRGRKIAIGNVEVAHDALNAAVFGNARKIQIGPVPYALLYEDGSTVPASVSLVRESGGRYFVSYHTVASLSSHQWILAADGLMWAIRLDASELGVYAKASEN
jgi:hypothetical protein